MEQRKRGRLAVRKDAPMLLSMEEFVSDMVQRSRLAVMKDAQTKFRTEEFVKNTVQRQRNTPATMKDVPVLLRKEEFA